MISGNTPYRFFYPLRKMVFQTIPAPLSDSMVAATVCTPDGTAVCCMKFVGGGISVCKSTRRVVVPQVSISCNSLRHTVRISPSFRAMSEHFVYIPVRSGTRTRPNRNQAARMKTESSRQSSDRIPPPAAPTLFPQPFP